MEEGEYSFMHSQHRHYRKKQLLSNGYRRSFPGVKRQKREVDHSSPSGVEVKNEWNYTSTPPIRLLGVERDDNILPLPRWRSVLNFALYLRGKKPRYPTINGRSGPSRSGL